MPKAGSELDHDDTDYLLRPQKLLRLEVNYLVPYSTKVPHNVTLFANFSPSQAAAANRTGCCWRTNHTVTGVP